MSEDIQRNIKYVENLELHYMKLSQLQFRFTLISKTQILIPQGSTYLEINFNSKIE